MMKINHIYKGYTILKEGFTEKYPYVVFKNNDDNEIDYFIDCEKSIEDAKKHIDEDYYNLHINDVTPLREHFEKYGNEYSWESTLEEELLESDWLEESFNPKEFNPKDIVMIKDDAGVHRILIVTKIEKKSDNISYGGYLLSSNVKKANKNSKYSNNIYINNYSTILAKGPKINKEAIIKVDNIRTFDKSNLDVSGNYKGTVTDEFFNFILKCASNYKNNRSNKDIFWEK